MKGLQKHNQQLTKQNKSIGLIKSKFSNQKIKIFEAYQSMKRIKDFNTNNDIKPLIDIIGKWRFYIGVKEELSQEELFMNVNFIRENFNELNLVDINEAINLSLKGVLNVDVEHYQSFTPLYISKILNAYKDYRNNIIYDIRQSLLKIDNKPKQLSPKDKVALTRASLKVLYESRNEKTFYDYGSVTYDFIKKNNLIKLTKDLVSEAMSFGEKLVSQNTRQTALSDVITNSTKGVKEARSKKEYNVRQSARNYVVQTWLNSFDEKSFDEFLETITYEMT
jgi:hypothetical protein